MNGYINVDSIEKEIENLTLEEMLERCKNENIIISDEDISSYMKEYNASKITAIKEMYLSLLMYYQEQEEALQEVHSDIIRSSY